MYKHREAGALATWHDCKHNIHDLWESTEMYLEVLAVAARRDLSVGVLRREPHLCHAFISVRMSDFVEFQDVAWLTTQWKILQDVP